MNWLVWLAVAGGVLLGVLQLLFQKNKLPKSVSQVVGRLLLYPTLPFTLVAYYTGWHGNFIDQIDHRVYLGSLPLPSLGRLEDLKRHHIKMVINMCDEY